MAITLRMITEEDLEMIMNWRMSESVTRFLDVNPKLKLENQKKWLEAVEKNDRARKWVIEVDGTPVGLINLENIDWENGSTAWGYYVGEEKLRSLHLAVSLEMSLYDYCFDILGFQEVHNAVFKLNEGVWKLHIACGCKVVKEIPGEIEKEGVAYDVVHLSIERDEWLMLRQNKKYEKVNFDIFHEKSRGGGVALHHLGVAVADIEKSIQGFREFGWKWNGEIIGDATRNVNLAFLRRHESGGMLELVSPANEKSPVSNTLNAMRNVSTPYHICYEVSDIERMINILKGRKYTLTDKARPAVAFDNRRVAFMLSQESGLVELLEKEKK